MNEDLKLYLDKMISKIPPIFSKAIIRTIKEDLAFFENFDDLNFNNNIFNPSLFHYFNLKAEEVSEISDDEKQKLNQILSLEKPQMFITLSKNPSLCVAASKYIDSKEFIKYYRKDIFNEFVSVALYGQNDDLVKFILMMPETPRPPLWPKPRFSNAIPWLLGPDKMPYFHPSKNNQIFSFNFPQQRKLSHYSSFAANHSQIFYGLDDGTILIEPYPIKNQFSQTFKFNTKILAGKHYSLAWAYDSLWVFTEENVYCIDIGTTNVTLIKDHPLGFFPVVSDGQYFYHFSNHIVYVYSFAQNKFHISKKIKIKTPIVIDKNTPFITNGLFITFAHINFYGSHNDLYDAAHEINKVVRRVYKQFSLINGAFIREIPCDFQDQNFSFCISAYQLHHIVLTSSHLTIHTNSQGDFQNFFQLPRWALGLNFLENHSPDLTAVFDALYFALYHDKDIFYNVKYENIIELISYYTNSRNYYGIFLTLMLICRNDIHSKNILQILKDYFMSEKTPVRRFLCFVYLLILRKNFRKSNYKSKDSFSDTDNKSEKENGRNSKKSNVESKIPFSKANSKNTKMLLKLPNIINTFLEEEYPPTFVWLFPGFFNFKTIQLSSIAIIKLIAYVTRNSTIFPNESYYILNAFLDYAFLNSSTNMEDFISPLNAIIISIEQKILELNSKSYLAQMFVKNSIDFKLWQKILKLTFKSKKYWPFFSSSFVKLFAFSLHNIGLLCRELNQMINCTCFLFLSLFSHLSFSLYPSFFLQIEDFYQKFPNPLNGYYKKADLAIFNVLKNCNDIKNADEFSKIFFRIRNIFLFETQRKFLNDLDQTEMIFSSLKDKNISMKCICDYIVTNDMQKLIYLQDFSIIHWFIQLFKPKCLDIYRQCIFSMFLSMFSKLKQLFVEASNYHPLDDFIGCFFYPFLLPQELISCSNIIFEADDIINLPVKLLFYSLKSIVKNYEKINEHTSIMIPFVNSFNYSRFQANFLQIKSSVLFNKSFEPKLYHDSLLWLIGFKCGEIIDYRNYIQIVRFALRCNTFRLFQVTIKWIYAAEKQNGFPINSLFDELIEIIGEYLYDLKNPFNIIHNPMEVSEAIFLSVHYCKKMFNLQFDVFRSHLFQKLRSSVNDFNKCSFNGGTNHTNIESGIKRTVLAIFAILNNCIDVMRPGVHCHILFNNFFEINGKVTYFDGKKLIINNKILYLSDFIQCWASPPIKTNLDLIQDKSIMNLLEKTFSNIHFKMNYQNVFKLAVINSLLKVNFFKKSISNEFKDLIKYQEDLPISFVNDNSYYNFTFYLANTFSAEYSFAFTSAMKYYPFEESKHSIQNENISINNAEQQKLGNNVFNEIFPHDKLKESDSGVLITTNNKVCFQSSPLHPNSPSTFKFKANKAIAIELYGISKVNNFALKYDLLVNKEKTELIFKIKPQTSIISIHGDFINDSVEKFNNLTRKIYIPPLKMIYFNLFLEPGTYCTYSYEIRPSLIFNSKILNTNQEYQKMHYSKYFGLIHSNSSSFFYISSLEFYSISLMNSLRQLNALEVMNNIPSKLIFDILFYSNPFPSDESLSFNSMLSFPLWNANSVELRKRIISHISKTSISSLIEEMINRKKMLFQEKENCSEGNINIVINRFNSKYIFFDDGDEIPLSNCYLVDQSSYSFYNLHQTITKVKHNQIIIPYPMINNSIFELIVNFRHLVIIFRFLGLSEFEKSIIHNLPNSFFKDIKSIVEYVFPLIPPKGEKPYYPEDSLLVKESIVHDYPNIFFYHKYFELMSPVYKLQNFVCNRFPMYFTVKDQNTDLKNEIFFEINSHKYSSKQFVILTDKTSAIPNYLNNVSVELIDRSFKVTSNDNSISFILDSIPDFRSIDKELQAWKVHHSIQLILSLDSILTKDIYMKLPISSQFSYEISILMFDILKKHANNIKNPKGIFSDSNYESTISYKDIKQMREFSFNKDQQSELIQHINFSSFIHFDPYLIYIHISYKKNCEKINEIKQNPYLLFKSYIKKYADPQTIDYLIQFIHSSPIFVVNLFYEYCTGNFMINIDQEHDRIQVLSIESDLFLNISRNDRLLMIGHFSTYTSFSSYLLYSLQKFQNDLVV